MSAYYLPESEKGFLRPQALMLQMTTAVWPEGKPQGVLQLSVDCPLEGFTFGEVHTASVEPLVRCLL